MSELPSGCIYLDLEFYLLIYAVSPLLLMMIKTRKIGSFMRFIIINQIFISCMNVNLITVVCLEILYSWWRIQYSFLISESLFLLDIYDQI